jgi:hypothetical protein
MRVVFLKRWLLCSLLRKSYLAPVACLPKACAKACASAKVSATRGQRRRTVAQAARRRSRQVLLTSTAVDACTTRNEGRPCTSGNAVQDHLKFAAKTRSRKVREHISIAFAGPPCRRKLGNVAGERLWTTSHAHE